MARVLVVDDDQSVRGLVARMLQKHHQVETAENGSVALEMCDAFDFDLVVSDMQMPVMDGEALLTHLRAKGHTMPFLLMSGHFPEEDSAIRLWADGFLPKPFLMGDLIGQVEAVLAKHVLV